MSEENEKKEFPAPEETAVETQHSVVINGETISYTATAGTYILKEENSKEGEPKAKAEIFYIAYRRNDVEDVGKRPLTFSFNGGPGSSSVWLHLGVLGPRRVLMDEMGNPLPPPAKLVDNEFSILDKTDLVFIDPVNTGYSRAVPGEEAKQFLNYEKDIEAVAEFIRLYLSRAQRWASPKFLIGESYGTTRASGLSGHLQDRHGIYMNGLMLISAVLNFQTHNFDVGNDLPYPLILPTYTATAWYHGRLDKALQKKALPDLLAEVEKFALTDYTLALMQGSKVGKNERKKVLKQLARYTGIAADYLDKADLRLHLFRFVKELRRDEQRTVGRLDSRFTGIDRDSAGETFSYDPSYSTIQGPYTSTFNDYIRRELNYESDTVYEILNPKIWPNWEYKKQQNRYLNVAETLRDAMSKNQHLKIFVANGYYDLATPYFATVYTLDHLGLDDSLQENISMSYYEAGHMMYVHLPSLEKMKVDLTAFLETAV